MDVSPLQRATEHALQHLTGVADRAAGPAATAAEMETRLAAPLPPSPTDPAQVVDELVAAVGEGLTASPGPRYFGFVTGGALPAALAADWLASAWDQNAFSAVSSPAAAGVEGVAIGWLKELLGLPVSASAGLTTGAQMANVVGLAAARHAVLAREGWDVAAQGLAGAPPIRVVVGGEAHVTVHRALRLLGLGEPEVVPADDQGRLRTVSLAREPTIVCAQAGNVNTGAFDDLASITEEAARAGAWVHVDGAFGLWAGAVPELAHLVAGVERADSWASDCHKWLNVPYDCGVVAVADPDAHRAAMQMTAAYLVQAEGRSNSDYVPEASRRARGFAVYAAIRSLGRDGITELVRRHCALARRMADELAVDPRFAVLNDVVLNQVLVRVDDSDAATDATVAAVQRDGTCWLGGTVWQGRAAIRISVSNWSTTEEDVDRAAAAIRRSALA